MNKKKKNNTIGLIGCGNMGGAILARGLKHRIGTFIVHEKDSSVAAKIRRAHRVGLAPDISGLVRGSSAVIIAVKPQDFDPVLDEIRAGIREHSKDGVLVISIAAGIPTGYIEKKLTGKVRVIRAMPNMPVKIGEGVTALIKGRFAGAADLSLAREIFGPLGMTLVVSKESLIDSVTAISGSGPAYFFYIFKAMETAARALGLTEKESDSLIRQTVIGSMHLLEKEDFAAEALISKVASKGGTTEAALRVFNDKKLGEILQAAIRACHSRAQELSRR
jgi:pyrroline-5-carboxylate reductase